MELGHAVTELAALKFGRIAQRRSWLRGCMLRSASSSIPRTSLIIGDRSCCTNGARSCNVVTDRTNYYHKYMDASSTSSPGNRLGCATALGTLHIRHLQTFRQ